MERFTQRARRVLSLAHQEAERMRHTYIGTEHLLLGLIREAGNPAEVSWISPQGRSRFWNMRWKKPGAWVITTLAPSIFCWVWFATARELLWMCCAN